MKIAIPAILLSLGLAAGCQQTPAKPPTDASTMDLNSAPAPAPVAYTAPIQTAAPDPALASATPASSASTNSYTVKRGDTLWHIAATHYGDGKKWKEIADANPGLTPNTLRVGQTITLP